MIATGARAKRNGDRLRLGVILTPYSRALEGRTPSWHDLSEAAVTAEAVGFDSVWVPDHLLFRREHGDEGAWECGSLLAALAAVTSEITIGSAVISTAFRNPALLAKIAGTIDEISGGRFVLGIGAGWNEAEFSAFGYPLDHRVARFEESIQILTALLRDGRADHRGRFHSAPDCTLTPRRDGPALPIIVGTLGSRMMHIAAKYADGWNGWLPRGGVDSPASSTPGALQPILERLDAACEAVGREAGTLQRTASVAVDTSGSGAGLISQWGDVISGSMDEISDKISEFSELGIDELWLALDPPGVAGIESMAPVLNALGAVSRLE